VVSPNEIARWLRVTGPQLRNWLRVRAKADHPLLASHQRYARWEFTPAEVRQLTDEYAARNRTGKPALAFIDRLLYRTCHIAQEFAELYRQALGLTRIDPVCR
jgi:hypothetical protein